MKFKKTAIALAMAGVVAAPMAAQAGSAADSIYASVRIGLQKKDTGGVNEATIRGYSARFGFKGETDLGNGMTGFGRYEWKVRAESSQKQKITITQDGTQAITSSSISTGSDIERRHAMVGVKGDFGKVYLGQTSHTFYNMIIAPSDSPWWGSGYTVIRYGIRTPSGISYAGDFGAVSFGITGYLDTAGRTGATDAAGKAEEGFDGIEAAIAFDAGPVRIAVGIDTNEDKDAAGKPTADDILGIAVYNIPLGDAATLAFNYQAQDKGTASRTSLVTEVLFGDFYLHAEMLDNDVVGGADPTSITLGYTQSLGPQTLIWYEAQSIDADKPTVANSDTTILRATLKYAF